MYAGRERGLRGRRGRVRERHLDRPDEPHGLAEPRRALSVLFPPTPSLSRVRRGISFRNTHSRESCPNTIGGCGHTFERPRYVEFQERNGESRTCRVAGVLYHRRGLDRAKGLASVHQPERPFLSRSRRGSQRATLLNDDARETLCFSLGGGCLKSTRRARQATSREHATDNVPTTGAIFAILT